MCAIGGLLVRNGGEAARSHMNGLRALSAAMTHRGPDGEGFFEDGPCALSHRLLRIYSQRTEAGPYTSEDGRWVLTFNGEIYNHAALKKSLEKDYGCHWRHESDCEVLLEGWAHEGESFLQKVHGMFAFGLWDRKEKTLILGRDRLGEKPLYYANIGDTFLFSSEIKALKFFGLPMVLNREALPAYLRYRYVPGPATLFKNVKKLLPGNLLFLRMGKEAETKPYWRPPTETSDGFDPEELFHLLSESHKERLQSVWRAGVLVSGGVDSSTVASFMPAGSPAWTLRSSATVDETKEAEATCARFGLQYKPVQLTDTFPFEGGDEAAVTRRVREAVFALEEPLGDSIILANLALADAVRQETRVVLSGEGADEIFGGYIHHWVYGHLSGLQNRSGRVGLRILRQALKHLPLGLVARTNLYPAKVSSEGRERLLRVTNRLISGSGPGPGLSALFGEEELAGIGATYSDERLIREEQVHGLRDLISLDVSTWLPDYTLTRMDKLMMSRGVESRLPFLDHRLVEYALKLPPHRLSRGFQRKWPLRAAMEERLGSKVAWRKKIPFLVDLSRQGQGVVQKASWQAAQRLCERGIFPPEALEALKGSAGTFLTHKKLFSLLVFEVWLQVFEIEV